MEPREVKDRILENISLSVKKLQSYFAACEDETPAIRNHDKVLQRLCEHLDHALLYGLQDLSSGYWVLVVHFTRREAVRQIEVLQHVATHLGRSRAWLYLALNENSLESYLRLFQENLGLLHKYYVKNALVCSHDHLTLFLTLVSGLEFIRFDLDLDAPYLDLAPYMPDYYKPQHLLDFEDRLPCSAHGSDSLSLNSFNSVTSTNLEWDDSAIAPSSEDYDFGDVFPAVPSVPSTDWEDGDLTDTVSGPRSTASDLTSSKASTKSPTQRHNPFNEEQAEAVSSSNATPVHTSSQGTEPQPPELLDAGTELEVIRVTKKKKAGKKKKTRSDEEASPLRPASAQHAGARRGDGDSPGLGRGSPDAPLASPQEKGEGPGGSAESGEHSEPGQAGLLIPAMKDTSMERLGQPLSKVIDQLNGQLDPRAWRSHGEPPDQPFRTGSPGDAPERPPSCDFSEGLPAPMDFYRFTVESPGTVTSGGGHHDPAGPGQPLHVPGGPAAAGQEEEGGGGGGEGRAPPPLAAALGEAQDPETRAPETRVPPGGEGPGPEPESGTRQALCELKRDQPSPCLSSAEDSGVEEGQGSPSEMSHAAEFRVDNNHLLLLMIHVFRENEEQLFRMIRMSTGHMEGTLQLLYVLLTDCYVYLLRKGATEKPYLVEEAVSYNELDYVSVGLDQQAVRLVCTNRRKQFLLDTADAALAEFFLASLKSAMIKGCREPPYPSILTDATMEKLALAKFVAQESKCEAAAVTVRFYGLVHWEDPSDESLGPVPCHCSPPEGAITKEGVLHYKAGTSYLGKELWKTCFVVLSNGILYQYPDRTDVIPLLSVNMGGEQCGGCRRSNTTDRPHAFQVILADRPCLELSAESEAEMADWIQHLCQAVSKGVIPQGVPPSPCIPCCLVITDDRGLRPPRAAARWALVMATRQRPFHLVVFGASGFTGQFVTEEVAREQMDPEGSSSLAWAVAGRSREKLQRVLERAAQKLGRPTLPSEVGIIICDIGNPASLDEMAKQATIVLNCVGPYRFYGEPVVKACVENGTSCIDISGEPYFLELMYWKYHEKAVEKGVYIIGSSGFDSIPADMGVIYTSNKINGTLTAVESFLSINSGPEGLCIHDGTWKSAIYGFGNQSQLKKLRKQSHLKRVPIVGAKLKRRWPVSYCREFNSYSIPFFGADVSVVKRTQRYLHENLEQLPVQYAAYVTVGGITSVMKLMFAGLFFLLFVKCGIGRQLLLKFPRLFSFGYFSKQGPTQKQIDGASFTMTFFGQGYSQGTPTESSKPNVRVCTQVKGPEAGYVTTPIAMVQAAVTLLNDVSNLPTVGGVFTPGAAFCRTKLIDRLGKRGIEFSVISSSEV